MASRNGNIEGIKILLEKEADINQPGFRGRTALHHAMLGNNYELAKFLLEDANAAADTPDEVGFVLRNYCDNQIFGCLQDGSTPLFFACIEGNLKAVELLHSFGAGVNHLNNAKRTPLMTAAVNSQLAVVDFLSMIRIHFTISNELNPILAWNLVKLGADANVNDVNLQNAIHHSARCDLGVQIPKLVSYGCNLLQTDKDGKTPADLSKDPAICKLLNT